MRRRGQGDERRREANDLHRSRRDTHRLGACAVKTIILTVLIYAGSPQGTKLVSATDYATDATGRPYTAETCEAAAMVQSEKLRRQKRYRAV